MAAGSHQSIKVDSTFISGLRDHLNDLRNQVTPVRGGQNPNDVAHPHGMPLNSVMLVAGHTNFANGQQLKSRVTAVAQQMDQTLTKIAQNLDQYSQNLDHILAMSDKAELDNLSLSDVQPYLSGSSGASGSLPAPPTPPASGTGAGSGSGVTGGTTTSSPTA
ncbi:hypothetical protein AB0J83_17665 [Actinoplanes sp. NPDC049596]|uniref:hypothetical protein n=1 Tax=unclassified Actinoplanes TaxID=2626549 RepID=UPI0034476CFF